LRIAPLACQPHIGLYWYKRKRRAKDDKKTRIKIKDRKPGKKPRTGRDVSSRAGPLAFGFHYMIVSKAAPPSAVFRRWEPMRPASRRFSIRFLYAGRTKVKSKPQEVESVVPTLWGNLRTVPTILPKAKRNRRGAWDDNRDWRLGYRFYGREKRRVRRGWGWKEGTAKLPHPWVPNHPVGCKKRLSLSSSAKSKDLFPSNSKKGDRRK
jgi:hypothetical protein